MTKRTEVRRRWPALNTGLALLLGLLAVVPAARAEFQVSLVPATEWGADDASLGFTGALVEDFEDATLVPGLKLELSDNAGQFPGLLMTSLPAVFDPVNNDPFGQSFANSVWDGAHAWLNIPGNVSVYYGSTDYRAVRIHVAAGATQLGVAMQQVTGNHDLVVNGQSLGRLSSLGIPVVPTRNGLMVVTALSPDEPITSVAFGGRGDAFCLDHIVYHPVPPLAVTETTWGALKSLFRE